MRVLVKGAGDLATGVAYVLHQVGYQVVMTEIEAPTVIRRSVSFAECMFEDKVEVEGVLAEKASPDQIEDVWQRGNLPVIDDPQADIVKSLKPDVLVDAILAKKNLGTRLEDAPIVIGLGPGFEAKKDVHVVVETMRGHELGRLYFEGKALANTGTPGDIGGKAASRVLRSPAEGTMLEKAEIGDQVKERQVVAVVEGQAVRAPFDGVLRGLLRTGLPVFKGMKIGDVDPRDVQDNCFTISDKARALGGATLRAILEVEKRRKAGQA